MVRLFVYGALLISMHKYGNTELRNKDFLFHIADVRFRAQIEDHTNE